MLKKYKKFLISPMIVTIIVLITYLLKGIYPFGKATIANGDMGQSYMTFYYFLYDIVYNGKCVLYDYTLGMGSNMYGGFIGDGLLNPSTFIIFLGNRANIPYMFSFVMIIKMAFIALTSYILFNKLNKENNFYNIIFSVLYALSGYVLTYNTNLMWLDVVGLFPLFILSIKYMFETDKIHWYAIILSLMLIFNYNLSYMVLMFIIFVIPIYIKFGIKKENRKKAVFNLIIGTIVAVGLSAFAFIPSFIQATTSYRMSSGTVKNTVTNENILYKIAVFIFYALPIYGYAKWSKYYKEDKNNFIIIGVSLIFSAILPIIFERINLIWHTGSYQLFPFRYGFIPTILLYIGALRYFGNFAKYEKIDEKRWEVVKDLNVIFFIALLTLEVCTAYLININIPAFFMTTKMFALLMADTIIVYIILNSIFNMNNEKVKKMLICCLTIIQIMANIYAYLGVPEEYRGGDEWSDKPVFISNKIYDKVKNEKTIYRLKDLAALTNGNSSLIYNIPSISTFLHIISTEQVLNHEQLGYSNRTTQLNDFGGTLLSDAVYGMKYVLTKEQLPTQTYTFVDDIDDDIKLYQYNKTLPIGFFYDNEICDIPKELKDFEAQNYLYKNLFNKQDDIIEINRNLEIQNLENGKYKCIINNLHNKELYLNADTILNNIKVNGKEISIPIINDKNNKTYKTPYCDGILDLGYFENEDYVEVEFESESQLEKDKIQIGILDIEKYNKIFEEKENDINVEIEKNKIRISGVSNKKQKLFIPVNYDAGWKCINGNVEIKRIYNTFIGIELKEGTNEILLEYKPLLFDICVKISILTVILMIIIYFVEKKYNIRNIKFIMIIFWLLGILIYIVAVFKIYIMSILKTIISFFV